MFFAGKLSAEEKERRKKEALEDLKRQQETKKRKKLESDYVIDVEDDVPPPPPPRVVVRPLRITDATASTLPPPKKKATEEAVKPAAKKQKLKAKVADAPSKESWEKNFVPAEKEAFSFSFPPGASTTKEGWPVVFPAVSQLPLPFDRAAMESLPGDDDVYQATRKAFWVST